MAVEWDTSKRTSWLGSGPLASSGAHLYFENGNQVVSWRDVSAVLSTPSSGANLGFLQSSIFFFGGLQNFLYVNVLLSIVSLTHI